MGGLLPFGEPLFNISMAEHGHIGLLHVPTHVVPILNVNQPTRPNVLLQPLKLDTTNMEPQPPASNDGNSKQQHHE